MKKISKIDNNHIVAKRNVLNEIRTNSMSLQELRFFSIYLSKINPKDTGTRIVRFPIDDFQSIMELGRMNINYLKDVTNSLLSKVVNIPKENGGYTAFQLFKECTVDQEEETGEWYIEIDAHDKALPLLFDFKSHYFSYELWNALRLKSSNQLRMYELLKQYEKIGYRIITVDRLKEYLGIKKDEYPRYDNFKKRILEGCQIALEENTDIRYTFEPYGRRGAGGKILSLKFNIYKNENYIDVLKLDEFIESQKTIFLEDEENIQKPYNGRLEFISNACDDEFSESEMEVLYLMIRDLPLGINFMDDMEIFRYLHRKYSEMNMRSEKNKITHRFGYLKKIIEEDI